ncbi:MAG: hypothetical protein M3619_17325 [Myxococcota bacterium]|nr:hypothetical protein [Myxococcota bacterium]
MTAACDRAFLVGIVLAVFAGTAAAQTPTPADAAFKRGRELLKAGKYADACIEFEHSNKLDPQLGTEFNIAQCSEKVGKLARALELYRNLLARDANPQRKVVVAEAIPNLEARVPKLIVRIATPPTGLSGLLVTLQPVQGVVPPREIEVNKPIEMDLGEYTLVAKGGGIKDWTATAKIDTEGKTTTLEIPVASIPAKPLVGGGTTPIAGPSPDGGPVDTDEPDAAPKSRRKTYAVVAMGVGGAALIGGVVFGSMAQSKWNEAKDVCGGTTCASMDDLARASELGDAASDKASISTLLVIAGGLAAAGGVVLWVTAPSEHEVRMTATPAPNGGAFVVSGRF